MNMLSSASYVAVRGCGNPTSLAVIAMFAFALVVALVGRPADAAEVKVISSQGPTIRLNGPIVSGDLEKLKTALAERNGAPRLLLDSPGGSYAEALRIADFMLGAGLMFPTEIESSARCLSACAIIFLAGNGSEDGPLYPWRHLHKNGDLGFHAPYIPELPERSYSGQELQNAYSAAVKSIRDLLVLARRHNARRGFIPTSLLIELLSKGPDQLFRVDTVYKAIKTGIHVIGYSPPRFSGLSSCNVCTNKDDLGGDPDIDQPPSGDQAEPCRDKRAVVRGNEAWVKWGAYDVQGYCAVRVRPDWPSNEGMVMVARRLAERPGMPLRDNDFESVDALYLFPPAMLLKDLP